jgi:RimJ/RimL family protein N-acetyltransferase
MGASAARGSCRPSWPAWPGRAEPPGEGAAALAAAGATHLAAALATVRDLIAAPDPPLSDGVVTLRPWQPDDVPALVDCIDGDEEMTRWLDMIPQPYRENEAKLWVDQATSFWREGTAAPFAILAADSGEVVGGVGFRWVGEEQGVGEVGYWLRARDRGRGLTTRSVELISRWAIEELGCERLQLRADEENIPSQRVAEKAGFTREGVLRATHYNARINRRVNFVMYSLLPSELPGRVA